MLNFIQWARDEFAITPLDVLSGINPVHFDNSVFDFYGALFTGAALAPLPKEIVAAAAELVQRVDELTRKIEALESKAAEILGGERS